MLICFSTFQQDACEYDDIGEVVQSMKKTSEFFSCCHYPKHDVERSAPLHIYEDACGSKGTERPRHSGLNVQEERDISAGIYIQPLPPASERAGEGGLGRHSNKSEATTNTKSKPTESCTRNAPACHRRSLWFGLDVSDTV